MLYSESEDQFQTHVLGKLALTVVLTSLKHFILQERDSNNDLFISYLKVLFKMIRNLNNGSINSLEFLKAIWSQYKSSL